MARRPRPLISIVAAGAVIAVAAAGVQSGAAAQGKKPKPPAKPDKVVIILVDALSKEIVDKYDMDNVQTLMSDYVDTPRSYLGHTGAVTVVSHNVHHLGSAPQAHGLDQRGLPRRRGRAAGRHPEGANVGKDLYITSDFGKDEIFALQQHYGYPKLADYLNDTGSVYTISPKAYAAYGFGGAGSTSIITFGSVTCPAPVPPEEPDARTDLWQLARPDRRQRPVLHHR